MRVSGLIPARFLTIVAHLVIVLALFWSRDDVIKQCLPISYTATEYDEKDTELIYGLSFALGLFLLELLGFMGGITMFMPFQSLLSACAHAMGTIAMAFFVFQFWPCDWFWYIFGFCNAFPGFTEILTIVGFIFFRKG